MVFVVVVVGVVVVVVVGASRKTAVARWGGEEAISDKVKLRADDRA